MDNIRKIKGYTTQIAKLEADIVVLKSDVDVKNKEISQKRKSIKELNNQIEALKKQGDLIKVSEHAIIRYLERVKGFDIEQIRMEIINNIPTKLIDVLGNTGKFPTENYTTVLNGGIVTTITKKE